MTTEIPAGNKIEFKRPGYRVIFLISADGLVCSALYEPGVTGPPMLPDDLREFFAQAKILEGIDDGAVAELLAKAAVSEAVAGIVIARGIPMIPGVDGRIDLTVRDLSDTALPEGDSGQMDLRHIQQFLNVHPDEVIGVLVPAVEGTPGLTLSGKTIPPQRGKELKVKLGKGVKIGEDGSTLLSLLDGRVYVRGQDISVEDTYVVKGDVDFRVGNITYNGFLEVSGDVLDGFSIKASKGIKVAGNIGTCLIESDGDIVFCGMAGQHKGTIRCGGTIRANFIHDTSIECEGNIDVVSEIINCNIKLLGVLRVNKGVLVGGNCIALEGVEVSTAGSPSSVFTRIVAGVNYHDLDGLNRLFNDLKQVIERFQASTDKTKGGELIKQRAAITEGIQEIRSHTYETANPKINVKKMLFEKVTITLDTISEEIKEECSGPLSLIANTVEGGVRFLSLTDLSVKAADIELFYVQAAEMAKQTTAEGEE